ncbi:MAG: hypothetical protein KAJ12_09930, partial [Bacteroidetes bacterium]|nr:hypothetical protein [Bacteroidota bacterium]
MSFIRILLLVIMGSILWRIIRTTMRLLSGRSRPNIDDLREKYRSKNPKQQFKDVQDADFEDITPKDTKDKPPRAKAQ